MIRDRDTVAAAPLTAAAEVLAVHAESAVGQPAAALEGQMAALRERIDATADRVARRRRAASGDPATS